MMKEFPLALIIKAVDRATGPLRRINDQMELMTKPIREFRKEWTRFGQMHGLHDLGKSFRNVGDKFSRVSHEMGRGFFKLAAIGGTAGYLFKTQLVDTAAEFEKLDIMLMGIAGSKGGAAKMRNWIQQFAFENVGTLAGTTDAFVRLKNWGIDPTTGSLQALIDQTARMGKGKETLDRMILAMGQMTAKGKIRAGEANQLTEGGVAVLPWLAERISGSAPGTKKFMAEVARLTKKQEQGQLGPKYIALLWEEMGRRSKGASARMMASWTGIMERFADLYEVTMNKIMASGVFDWMKGKAEEYLATVMRMLKDGSLDKWAKEVGKNITEGLTAVWEALPAIWQGLKDIFGTLKDLADLVGGWGNVMKIAAVIMAGPLLSAIMSLVGVLWAMAAAIAAISAPVAVVLAVLALLGAAIFLLASQWDDVVARFEMEWEVLKGVWTAGVDWVSALITDWNLGEILSEVITAAFNMAAAFVPQWFKDLAGGAFNFGMSLGNDLADYFGAEGNVPAAAPVRSQLDVNFNNMPRGSRYVAPNPLLSGVNVSAGVSMRDSW